MPKYPTILIHGFFGFGEDDLVGAIVPYWGFRPDCKLPKIIRAAGYEVYAPNVGPFNSAWDRACIIYAYLFGGTVDFGKVHAEKYGHARYGRTYPGVLKDLGQTEEHAKINVVGHSFGGPTVLALCDLFTNGNQEEIEGTPEDELSPLFKGGHGDLIHTATMLSGVSNGTTLASILGPSGVKLLSTLVTGVVYTIGNSSAVLKFWDFNMDAWGFNANKFTHTGNRFRNPFSPDAKAKYATFNKNYFDSIGYEMSIECCADINATRGNLNPNTYYFARRGDRSHPKGDGTYAMDKSSFFISKFAGLVTNLYKGKNFNGITIDPKYGYSMPEWGPSDGLVNVPGQSAPFNQPYEDADFDADFKPGIFYNLPVEYKDHMSWCGAKEDREVYVDYMMHMIQSFDNLD